MPNSSDYTPIFQSVLAQHFTGHLKEKRAGGYRYRSEASYLEKIDRFLFREGHNCHNLPKYLVELWITKQDHECHKTHSSRVVILRQFAKYLLRQGLSAYVPPPNCARRGQDSFVPYIFSSTEIKHFLAKVDHFQPSPRSPRRHIVMPELFRLLIFCGLRISEVLSLCVKDVNLETGVLTIRNTKFDTDRLVPMSRSITDRLRVFAERLGIRNGELPFFPSLKDRKYYDATIYHIFRAILKQIRVEHRGRGLGPRLHDFRHTFAVQRLLGWYREGADLNAKLLILATYLGHRGMNGTQRYLRLVPELFPEVTMLIERSVGHIIPGKELP
jgi:integrase/recombinase XerD